MDSVSRQRVAILTAVLVLILCGSAAADGPGVRAGDLIIHPRVSVAGGYDDNVFVESEDEPSAPLNTATVLKIGGGLSVGNRRPNRVALELDTSFVYRHLTSLDGEPQGNPEAEQQFDEAAAGRNGLEEADVGLKVGILPASPITIDLQNRLQFWENPVNERSGEGFEKLDNAFGADLRFRPGEKPESRAFEMQLGYRYRTVRFLEELKGTGSGAGASRGEKDAHEAHFLTEWRFLPKTMLLTHLVYHVTDYPTDPDGTNRDATPFYGKVGLRGLVTRRISVVLKGGYANTFNEVGESYSGPIGEAQIQYVFEPTLSATLGYTHAASDSTMANYEVVDRISFDTELTFFGRLALSGGIAFSYKDYSRDGSPGFSDEEGPQMVPPGERDESELKRDDPILSAKAGASWLARDWLSVTLSWTYENDMTDYVSGTEYKDTQAQDPAKYRRQVVLATVEAKY